MDQSIKRLNQLSADRAEAEFLKCCGSTRWAKQMTEARPFTNIDELFSRADEIWWSLSTDDWLEAFRTHPKIGEKKAATAQSPEARNWSAQEQSQSQQAAAETKSALAEGNRKYEERVRFIFIVCATGKSSEEILSILNCRMPNERETELKISAGELRMIIYMRIEKLLHSL